MIKTLPTIDGIKTAKEKLNKYSDLKSIPLKKSKVLSEVLGANVYLKDATNESPIRSFKLRGALNHLLNAKNISNGAVTSSTGNHGQGVAYACKLLGIQANIFLPKIHNILKKQRIESFGGIVHLFGKDIDESKEEAKLFAAKNKMEFVDDGESAELIHGAGTIGLEIGEEVNQKIQSGELENKNLVAIVQLGSGSLASGVAIGIKGIYSKTNLKVIAVQAEGAPAMYKSFHAKKAVHDFINTIADGIVCRIPAELALKAVIETIDDAKLVSDEEILSGIHTLKISDDLIVEPSAAVSVAAAFKYREEISGKNVVLVLTGANILDEYLEKALKAKPFI